MTHPSQEALADRLLAHAKVHDDLAKHSDEQKQWADDLRDAAALLRSQQPVSAELLAWANEERPSPTNAYDRGLENARAFVRSRLAGGEPATIEDNSQSWAGMDGATAWHLIDRHADGWNDVAKMMREWLEANIAARLSAPQAVGWLPIETAPKELAAYTAGVLEEAASKMDSMRGASAQDGAAHLRTIAEGLKP